ncbi:MAG: exosortase/archaeosortase family protein [Bryobacteraceae bacterium]
MEANINRRASPIEVPAEQTSFAQFPTAVLPALLWFTLLLIVLYLPVLTSMVREWAEEEEMGHGFFVPVVAGAIIWREWGKLLLIPIKPFYPAVLFIILGFGVSLLGSLGADFFLARVGFVIALYGVVWTLTGTALVKQLIFPFFLLLFMIRMPLFIYSQITFPLQLFASAVAEHALNFIGIPVFRDGNILELASRKLSVVEACSGIRSLISLSFLSLVYGYYFDSKKWMRWALLASTVPIAIFANAGRVTLTGIISVMKAEFADGFYHSLEGGAVFMFALIALVLTHQVINRSYQAFSGRKA